MIAFADRHTGVIHVQPVEAARHPCSDLGELGLVILDFTDQADVGRDRSALDCRGGDRRQFLCVRGQTNFAGTERFAGRVIIDRDQVHCTNRTLACLGLLNLGVH